MIKQSIMAVLFLISHAHGFITTIKNDTTATYFITCDALGYLLEPNQEVKIDIPEISWFASWFSDPSVMTLYKKIGDEKEFAQVFQLRPKATEEEEVLIFMSDVHRKARHVSAPFTVKALGNTKQE